MLSYNAPSVEDAQNAAAIASSEASSTTDSTRPSFAASEEPSLTDNSSISSRSSPSSPQTYNTHMEYFDVDGKHKPTLSITTDSLGLSDGNAGDVSPTTVLAVPSLPKRAASHSKREHVRLARRRSQKPSSLRPMSSSSSFSDSSSAVFAELADHPFSQELEQLSEAVEELGALVEEEDEHVMEVLGLRKWSPEEYLWEVSSLTGGTTPFE